MTIYRGSSPWETMNYNGADSLDNCGDCRKGPGEQSRGRVFVGRIFRRIVIPGIPFVFLVVCQKFELLPPGLLVLLMFVSVIYMMVSFAVLTFNLRGVLNPRRWQAPAGKEGSGYQTPSEISPILEKIPDEAANVVAGLFWMLHSQRNDLSDVDLSELRGQVFGHSHAAFVRGEIDAADRAILDDHAR